MGKKPVLVIMAAGMGSRYGGLKQIDPIDEHGDKIIDFSIYDAVQAGFEKVVFIIKKAIEKEFKEQIGDRISKHVQVEYVYQELDRFRKAGRNRGEPVMRFCVARMWWTDRLRLSMRMTIMERVHSSLSTTSCLPWGMMRNTSTPWLATSFTTP